MVKIEYYNVVFNEWAVLAYFLDKGDADLFIKSYHAKHPTIETKISLDVSLKEVSKNE